MEFPARFQAEPDGGYCVTFRDIPEAITQGDTLEEAREMARDALLTAMDFYFDDQRQVPAPSAAEDGEELVGLPASAAAKVLLLNAMLARNVRPVDLARAMKVTPQEVTRITDLHHTTKIDKLQDALEAMGMRLVLQTKSKHAA